MNSYLKFESEEGKGSEFWFTLTIPTRHSNRSGIYNETAKGKRGLSILLVEDNLLNQKFAKITLGNEGHLLEIAENGKVAVEKFKQNPYDLILMDIQMPIMSGIEATKEIRQIEAEQNLKPIKIIAVTAFSLDDKRKECMDAGMDNFLSKPFKPNQLIKIIEAVKFD
jgi:CheY-like chemotaxis protein